MDARLVGPIALILTLVATDALSAQADTSGTQPPPEGSLAAPCWVPRPAPRCPAYLVTELTIEKPFRAADDDLTVRYGWTLGPMINLGARNAVGVLGSWVESPYRSGPFRVEGRYRRWLTGSTGLDLTLGYTKHDVAKITEPSMWLHGVTAAAAVDRAPSLGHGSRGVQVTDCQLAGADISPLSLADAKGVRSCSPRLAVNCRRPQSAVTSWRIPRCSPRTACCRVT